MRDINPRDRSRNIFNKSKGQHNSKVQNNPSRLCILTIHRPVSYQCSKSISKNLFWPRNHYNKEDPLLCSPEWFGRYFRCSIPRWWWRQLLRYVRHLRPKSFLFIRINSWWLQETYLVLVEFLHERFPDQKEKYVADAYGAYMVEVSLLVLFLLKNHIMISTDVYLHRYWRQPPQNVHAASFQCRASESICHS